MTDGPSTGRPVIGVTSYVEPVDRAPWRQQTSAVLPHDYVRQVEQAGGLAVVLPPRVDADDAMALDVVRRLDGVILSGGADVAAERYGATRHPVMQDPRPDRDAWEWAVVRATAHLDVPLLGICRGMQVMAAEAGGELQQHLPELVGHDGHQPEPGRYAHHSVTCVPDTRLAEVLGTDELQVPTYHHQGVLSHPGYTACAWHADGTLEAIEDPDARFRLAVQWHPEAGTDGRLFEALVQAARVR